MRTAICLSGHVRRFHEICQNFFDYLYLPFSEIGEVDIFISTWTELNTADSFSVQQNDTIPDNNKLNIESFYAALNPVSIVVDDFNQIKDNFLIDKFYTSQILHPLSYNHDTKVQYCLPMFYKWFNCNELKRQHEIENNFKYDYVIKARFDLFFFRPILPTEIDLDYLYFRVHPQDLIILGSSENVDKVCGIYPNLKNLITNYEFDYLPEQFLEYQLQENNLGRNKRKYLGETSCWIYPRKNFMQSCYDILKRYDKEREFYELMTKYKFMTKNKNV